MRIESDRYKEVLQELEEVTTKAAVTGVRAVIHLDADEERVALLDIEASPDCDDDSWTAIWSVVDQFLMLLRDDLQRHIDDDAPYTWPVWGDIDFTLGRSGVIARDDSLHAEPKGSLPVGIKIDYSGLIAID